MKKINFLIILFSIVCANSFGQFWLENFDGSNTTNPPVIPNECNGVTGYYGIVCGFNVGCGNSCTPIFSDCVIFDVFGVVCEIDCYSFLRALLCHCLCE